MIRRFAYLGALALFIASPASAAEPPLLQALSKAMQVSADAWNRGDLEAFMAIYEHSADTAFVTPKGVVKGFEPIEQLYKKAYGGAGGLGSLTYSDLSLTRLNQDYAILYGRFHLMSPSATKEATGVFDLVMHKTTGGWRILSDHTS